MLLSVPICFSLSFPTSSSLKFQDTGNILYIPLFRTKFSCGRKYVVSFVRKTNEIVRSLFIFVAAIQEESHGNRIYISFYLFCINSKNNRLTGRSKISLVFKNFPMLFE